MPSTSDLHHAPAARSIDERRVPVIDCTALFGADAAARTHVVARIGEAFTSTGFFYASGIGIDPRLIRLVLEQMDTFFSLPATNVIKQQVHHEYSEGGRGWMPLYAEPSYQPGTVSHVESFDCGPSMAHFRDHEDAAAQRVYPNAWPKLPGFRASVATYRDRASYFGQALFEALDDFLQLPPRFLSSRCTARAPSTLRLLNYPENTAPSDDVHVGIAAHTDFECITLLYQDAPGLELRDRSGNWYHAPHAPDRFIVILGDMIERWTNGRLQATGHRVPNTSWKRNSLVTFFAADAHCVVEPLPQFVSETNPPRYAPVTQQQHIEREWDRASELRDTPVTGQPVTDPSRVGGSHGRVPVEGTLSTFV